MKKNGKEELQSRREFFKKAAKGVLPIIGAIALGGSPIISFAQSHESEPESGCDWGCSGTCWSSCQSSCRGTCAQGCTGSCAGGCKGACANSCNAHMGSRW